MTKCFTGELRHIFIQDALMMVQFSSLEWAVSEGLRWWGDELTSGNCLQFLRIKSLARY